MDGFFVVAIVYLIVLWLMLVSLEWIETKKKMNNPSVPSKSVDYKESYQTSYDSSDHINEVELQVEEILEETAMFITKDVKDSLEAVKSIEDTYVLNGKEVPEEVELEMDEFEQKYNTLVETLESLKQEAEELKSEMDDYISDFE